MEKEKKYAGLSTCDKMQLIADWLEDRKAVDLIALDLNGKNALTEGMIIVTATSTRHAQGLSDYLYSQCKDHKFERLQVEGYESAQWILVDLNDVVVHILQPESRGLYRLEDLWPAAHVVVDRRQEESNE